MHAYGHVLPRPGERGVKGGGRGEKGRGDSWDSFDPSHPHSLSQWIHLEHFLESLQPLLFAAWSHWVALALFTTFSNTSYSSACCWLLFYHGSWGPDPGCFFMVPSPGCFSFFTSVWHVFHPPRPMRSMPTSPSESQLPIHPWNQLNSDVANFWFTQAFWER